MVTLELLQLTMHGLSFLGYTFVLLFSHSFHTATINCGHSNDSSLVVMNSIVLFEYTNRFSKQAYQHYVWDRCHTICIGKLSKQA